MQDGVGGAELIENFANGTNCGFPSGSDNVNPSIFIRAQTHHVAESRILCIALYYDVFVAKKEFCDVWICDI